MKPIISIIIPFYNVEKYIARCIDSVKNQTFTNFECLLIDDQSPDSSLTIAKKSIGNDSRFRIIQQKNKGLGGARNTGIIHSQGQWIAFLDSDDYWDSNFLEHMLNCATQENADVVACNHRCVNEQNKPINDIITFTQQKSITQSNDIFNELINNHIAWDKLYKKSLWDTVRFPEKLYHEDFATLYKIAPFCHKWTCTTKILYNYLRRESSITGSFSERNIDDIFTILKQMHKEIPLLISCIYIASIFSITIRIYNDFNYPTRDYLLNYLKKQHKNEKNILNINTLSVKNKIKLYIFELLPNSMLFFLIKITFFLSRHN